MASGQARRRLLLLLLFTALAPAPALAQGGMCGPANDPVLIVLVESPAKVQAAADGLSRAKPLVRAPDTVIFGDGRAVTSSLAAMSAHLNALGWASRPIEIVGAGTVPRAPIADSGSRGGRRRG